MPIGSWFAEFLLNVLERSNRIACKICFARNKFSKVLRKWELFSLDSCVATLSHLKTTTPFKKLKQHIFVLKVIIKNPETAYPLHCNVSLHKDIYECYKAKMFNVSATLSNISLKAFATTKGLSYWSLCRCFCSKFETNFSIRDIVTLTTFN